MKCEHCNEETEEGTERSIYAGDESMTLCESCGSKFLD